MVEAAQTTASTAETWAIVIVAVVALAFWLGGIFVADRMQVRASGRSRAAMWPPYTGAWTGGSVAGAQAEEIPEEAVHEPIEPQGQPVGDEQAKREEAPTRADIPAQPGPAGRPTMPRQRTGESDRAGRSYAGQPGPEEEDPGR